MVRYIFAAAALAATVSALPLNINLGAYSPALVVGDGEISFGGKQDVSALMNVLEGAAVNAAAAGTANAAAASQAAAAPAAEASATTAEAVSVPAPVALAPADPNLNQQAQQISALQGMGKEIAPRPREKRDLASFDRALKFAEAALTKGPKVQLGTGAKGSGVGIIVDNNQEAAARAGTGNAAEGAKTAERSVAARDLPAAEQPRRRAKVTTMYVRSGIPEGLQASSEKLVAREEPVALAESAPVSKRSESGAIDAINLNVRDGEGITMTFVETEED